MSEKDNENVSVGSQQEDYDYLSHIKRVKKFTLLMFALSLIFVIAGIYGFADFYLKYGNEFVYTMRTFDYIDGIYTIHESVIHEYAYNRLIVAFIFSFNTLALSCCINILHKLIASYEDVLKDNNGA